MYCVHITGPAWTLLLRMYLHSALAQDEMSARRRPCALLGPTVYTTARLLVQCTCTEVCRVPSTSVTRVTLIMDVSPKMCKDTRTLFES
ncbi:hypothetical protein QR685DRAFT_132572 [Neurospora intermedia]|uniref:Secreted protein n=1 Tax=Neurospora intermedia TaxID=5142 RepID=A0ABR3D145_NEUIN